MLRFFRTLRQRLLAENRVSRYVLYALGEIALVVIGILIALQVNTWNESRKARVQEIKIYKEILNDLQVTQKEVRKDMDNHIIMLKSTEYLIRHIAEKQAYSDSVLNAFFNANSDLQVFPKSSGFEALNSIGLDLLSNDSVRIKITDLYQLSLKRVVELGYIENPGQDLTSLTKPFIKKYMKADLEAGQVRTMDYAIGSTSVYPPKIHNYHAFLEDQELFGVLNNSAIRRAWKIRTHYNTALELEDVIQSIGWELNRIDPAK